MLVILILPILMAFGLSFTNYTLGAADFQWVGLKNYEDIFTRSTYEKMLSATFTYVAVVVPGSILLGLLAALAINSLAFGKGVYRTIYFLPVMATLVAMAIVWELALHPSIGIINRSFEGLCAAPGLSGLLSFGWLPFVDGTETFFGRGCVEGFPNWLGNRDTALATLCFIGIWQALGFNMVLYMAGLTAVPRELYHAAEMDGATSAWSRFWLVTWPMLGPTNVFVVTITAIRSFQSFDTIEALTEGGPSKSTYVMMYALFEKGIRQNLIGVAAAITVLFLIFVFIITLIQRHLVERRVTYA
ncbi:MAG: carbohydrate ABC transporter permease [Geminicoccaceae bacterium]